MGGRRSLYIVLIFCAQKAWENFGMKSSFDWFDLHRNPLASCKMQAITMQGGNASVLLCKAGGAEALGLLSPGQQPLQLRIAHAPSTMAHRPSMDLRMSVRRRDRCRLQPDYLRQQFQMDGVCHAHVHYLLAAYRNGIGAWGLGGTSFEPYNYRTYNCLRFL